MLIIAINEILKCFFFFMWHKIISVKIFGGYTQSFYKLNKNFCHREKLFNS